MLYTSRYFYKNKRKWIGWYLSNANRLPYFAFGNFFYGLVRKTALYVYICSSACLTSLFDCSRDRVYPSFNDLRVANHDSNGMQAMSKNLRVRRSVPTTCSCYCLPDGWFPITQPYWVLFSSLDKFGINYPRITVTNIRQVFEIWRKSSKMGIKLGKIGKSKSHFK